MKVGKIVDPMFGCVHFFRQSLTEIQNIVQSDQTKIEDNEILLTEIINQIDYEIRCIERFGKFFGKSIWMLFYEYFPQKVIEMVMTWKTQLDVSKLPGTYRPINYAEGISLVKYNWTGGSAFRFVWQGSKQYVSL